MKIYLVVCLILVQMRKKATPIYPRTFDIFGSHNQKQKFSARVRQLLARIGDMANLLNDLMMSLHFMKKNGSFPLDYEKVVLLTDSRWSKGYLNFLSLIKIIPRMEIVSFRNSNGLKSYLKTYDRAGRNSQLVLTRHLYTKFHALECFKKIQDYAFII